MPPRQKSSLWYKYENNASMRIRFTKLPQPVPDDPGDELDISDIKQLISDELNLNILTFTLKVKRSEDTESIELDDSLLGESLNIFDSLKDNFNITKTNPIIVEAISSTTGIQEIGSLTAGITRIQLEDKKIWVRYKDKPVSLRQYTLEELKITNVDHLKSVIKTLFNTLKNVNIKLRRSETLEVLKDNELITDMYNTEDNAFVVIETDDESSLSYEEGGKIFAGASKIDSSRIEGAFQIEYQGTTLDTFYLRLEQFHDEWCKQEKSYAPYLTIIQSSGSGKTRLVGELRTKGIYVLYICKRRENNSGYPASTPYAQKIFDAIRDNTFKTLLSVAIKEIKNRDWNEEEFWNIQIKDEHKDVCNHFWESVFGSLSLQKNPLSDENFVIELFPGTKIRVVCCIDEAHELLSKAKDEETYFVRLRREVREIQWHGFFNILLSTNGKIGNFLPPVTKDTISARSHDFEIFPAYLDVNTMDVLVSLSENPAENANKNYNYERTVYLGIPLWGSLFQAGLTLTSILHLASQKIRNFSKKDNNCLANLACMACSLALEVSPRIAVVDSLIASHMATAIGVSLDRTCILCTYPSDTILASGALKGIIDVGWKNCLDTLLELFSRGVVEAGERGELVNRILFLKAYADAVKGLHTPVTYLQKVPLQLFLKTLLRNEVAGLDDLLINMGINEAEVGFNHWIALLATNQDYVNSGGNKFLSENLVIEAYHRHAAFKMPLGFHVIDHIIPFRYNAGYGIITIQNKNAKKKTFDNNDISSLVHPLNAFGKWIKDFKILGIYIDLGLDRNKSVEAKAEIKKRNVPRTRLKKNKNDGDKKEYDQIIYIQSIKTFNCDDEISKSLSKLLYTRPWPLDIQWSMFDETTELKREDEIKSFLPLVFEQKQSLVDKWQLK